MPDQIPYTVEQHALYIEERKLLIDASRESSRTFDKAMLTFGSAIFGFSVAFIKDVAPQPVPSTLWWLGASWILFTVGLLAISLSFLFSQWACDFEIIQGENILKNPEYECPKTNRWSTATTVCNISCVVLLTLGIMCWSWFAIHNLGQRETTMSSSYGRSKEQTGYTPPSPPPRVPTPQPAPPSQPPPKK